MTFTQSLKVYLQYALKHKWLYVIFNITILFTAVTGNIVPIFFKDFITITQSGNLAGLAVPVTKITIILILDGIFSEINKLTMWRVYWRMLGDLKIVAFQNLQDQDYQFHINKSSGKLIAVISRAEGALRGFMVDLNMNIISSILNLSIPIIIIATISVPISLAITAIILLAMPIFIYFVRKNVEDRKKVYIPDAELSAMVVDNLIGFETVKAFAKEKVELKRLSNKMMEFIQIATIYSDNFRIMTSVVQLAGIALIIASVVMGVNAIQQQTLDLGGFIVIISLIFPYPRRLFDFVLQVREIGKSYADFVSFIELLFLPKMVLDKVNPKTIISPLGKLEFRNVTFGYGKSNTISDMSLIINPAEKVALVGPSGGGKSTITKLILRYYETNQGEILLDDININDLSQAQLRELIGVVPQDPLMFNDSIFYNVGYAMENTTLADIERVCKLAQIDSFIQTLPAKYETIVGERGIKLSGGQRQRLAIARMILKNPDLIIFDEATSALDSENEQAIHKALTELIKNKTAVIIAHRLSTIVHCDKIVVIDEGRIIQVGTHQELIKVPGVYQKLWNIQSGGFLP